MIAEQDQLTLSRTLPFWEHLTEPQKSQLVENASVVNYTKGNILHSADAHCVGMLVVISGSLRVYMLSEEGREITLYRIHSGETCILSASCVLESITFDVYIDTVEDSHAIQISACAISDVMQHNIYADAFIHRLATERFSDVMWVMQQILFMSFDKRLAIFLLDEAASSGSDELSMTHEQIAKFMGSAREVVTRMLKYFSSERYVALSRGTVKILDKDSLKKLIF